jgi:peptidoglycan hydrolase CwlO-like protein
MKLKHYLLITALAAPVAVFADTHLTQIRDNAAKLNTGFRDVDRELRNRQFNLAAVNSKVDLLDQEIANLKSLVSNFEASNPKLSAEAQKDLAAIKETIALLDMFHEHKSEMLKGDVAKLRGQLRAQAQNLSLRATHLEKTSARLLKTIGSGS